MDEYIKFFYEIGVLKEIKRRGWVLRGIKDPETVAQHSFRVLLLSWILAKGRDLNVKRLLKLALVHSLSAVYIDYLSPYDKLLDIKGSKDALRYPALVVRAPVAKKGKITEKRYKEEEKAVKRLIKDLPDSISHEILYLWNDFQHKTSKEAQFLYVVDKLENLIQALEYKDKMSSKLLNPFLKQIREITNDKEILNLTDNLNNYFLKGEKSVKRVEDRNLIKFIIKIGSLKNILRKGWVIRGVKDPVSIADHSFRSALMAWVFSNHRRIDQEVAIVTAAIHDLFTVELGDVTYYDSQLKKTKNSRDQEKVVESLPWIGSRAQKAYLAKKRMERESKALDKVLKLLPHHIRHEIKFFWLEYKTNSSREGKYLSQIDRIEALLQGIQYQSKNKKISITSFWLQLKGLIYDPILIYFVEAVDRSYFGKTDKKLPS